MGPVEAELRRVGARWWAITTPEAFQVWTSALLGLCLFEHVGRPLGALALDVSSEAIEAAEALGL